MDDILYRSATDLARMLRRKEVFARELTEALLTRIDAVNPALNAIVELRSDDAVRQAHAADDATARGEDLGPLHGIPMTIKDCFNVAGCTRPGAIPRSGTTCRTGTPRWSGA
jgi:amidase